MSPQRHRAVIAAGSVDRRHGLATQEMRRVEERAARTRAGVVIRHTAHVAFSDTH